MSQTRSFRLGATGDILLHLRLIEKAKQENDQFNFTPQMENVRDLFNETDLNIVNQESIIGGEKIGYSDFPKFNSPAEISDTLKEFGVDMVTIANNHTLDKGEEGIYESIKNWEKSNLPYVGAYKSEEDFNTLRVIHKNGLRIGFVSITKRMAGVKVPQGKPWIIDSFDNANVVKICKRLRKIKTRKLVDVLIVSCHFGKEYHFIPTADQQEISKSIADAGADVILGHHPHVLQPMEYLFDSRGWDTFVAYSLGNFFSGQKGVFRQIGGFLNIGIEKPDDNSPIKFTDPTFTLTFTDMYDGFKMHKLSEYMAENKTIKTHMGEFSSEEAFEKMKSVVTKWMPELKVK
ncbi:poly-gamma-glutamate synthesis protein (capsule biosynthesis protein) [Gracilibacillus orientalis]|uniref:Poly-gamma-glutamate synthesis protein (Capsule biosynthesis protein) n=1 Tax=Gracilibacillus orientalis TaxID=334253 RepID=A0A1I4PI17_9BACI|nr:CapA family protein [Gracilibacillus orientalis]SFM27196.1 poly-gamma-glutamate synthesis protein (capsule biosynthesis protein) [Gracilibacillus orientalis]